MLFTRRGIKWQKFKRRLQNQLRYYRLYQYAGGGRLGIDYQMQRWQGTGLIDRRKWEGFVCRLQKRHLQNQGYFCGLYRKKQEWRCRRLLRQRQKFNL